MTPTGPSLADIKAAAQARIGEVLAGLGIRDPARGGYIHICNPVEKDRHPSFTIWTTRAIGAWKDHRGIAQGDIIDLVAYLKGWYDGPHKGRREALRWLADLLGLHRLSAEQRQADAARSKLRAQREDKRAAEALASKQTRAFRLWLQGAPLEDTAVDYYLRARGIDLTALPAGPRGGVRAPHIIRYLPNHRHAETDRCAPCMIAGCIDPAGAIRAVHRTWIDPVTFTKADLTPNRKCWPDVRGLVIPLWRGESGLSVREAERYGLRETLVLAEGIETALSAAIAAPQYRTWAFISLGNLANVVLPACVDSVMLHRENDHGNHAAAQSFARGKAALERQGRPVAEIAAPVGKDLNDTLRGAA